MRTVLCILSAATIFAAEQAAHAAAVTIDFDGLDGGRDYVHIEKPGNFYNGGLGSMGSGPGPNYGITFLPIDATSTEPRAICNATFDCDGGKGNSLFIFGDEQNGKEHGTILRIEGGFRGIFEFDAATAAGPGAYVSSRTSMNNPSLITLGVIKNPNSNDTCGRLECAFRHYTFNLADDPFTPDDVVAHYIVFNTQGTDTVFIDNIYFHDLILPESSPTTVPEPFSLPLVAASIAGLALARPRKRKESASTPC